MKIISRKISNNTGREKKRREKEKGKEKKFNVTIKIPLAQGYSGVVNQIGGLSRAKISGPGARRAASKSMTSVAIHGRQFRP